MQSQIRSNRASLRGLVIVLAAVWLGMLCLTVRLHASAEDWQSRIRQLVQQQELTGALAVAEDRLAEHPDDLEARGWRARLLAWTHRWNESEIEYQAVLQSAPHDMDIVVGLADLLFWQERSAEALTFLDQATALDASRNDLHLRRGRVLHAMGRRAEAGAAYSRVSSLEGLFQRRSDDRAATIIVSYGNRSYAPRSSMVGDLFRWYWQRGFSPGPTSEENNRFYRRFGLAASRWDPTNSYQTSSENPFLGRGGAERQWSHSGVGLFPCSKTPLRSPLVQVGTIFSLNLLPHHGMTGFPEFLSGGRPQASNGMNYALRF